MTIPIVFVKGNDVTSTFDINVVEMPGSAACPVKAICDYFIVTGAIDSYDEFWRTLQFNRTLFHSSEQLRKYLMYRHAQTLERRNIANEKLKDAEIGKGKYFFNFSISKDGLPDLTKYADVTTAFAQIDKLVKEKTGLVGISVSTQALRMSLASCKLNMLISETFI